MSSGTKVSPYERARRLPSLETALAYEALFGVPARELFAGVFSTITHDMRRRASHLATQAKTPARKQVALKIIADPASPERSPDHAK